MKTLWKRHPNFSNSSHKNKVMWLPPPVLVCTVLPRNCSPSSLMISPYARAGERYVGTRSNGGVGKILVGVRKSYVKSS